MNSLKMLNILVLLISLIGLMGCGKSPKTEAEPQRPSGENDQLDSTSIFEERAARFLHEDTTAVERYFTAQGTVTFEDREFEVRTAHITWFSRQKRLAIRLYPFQFSNDTESRLLARPENMTKVFMDQLTEMQAEEGTPIPTAELSLNFDPTTDKFTNETVKMATFSCEWDGKSTALTRRYIEIMPFSFETIQRGDRLKLHVKARTVARGATFDITIDAIVMEEFEA